MDHPLKRHRDAHGLSQSELGEELGVSMQTIWRWEHAKRTPRKHHLIRIKKRLGIEPRAIIDFVVWSEAAE